jgi:hypothetical protein
LRITPVIGPMTGKGTAELAYASRACTILASGGKVSGSEQGRFTQAISSVLSGSGPLPP